MGKYEGHDCAICVHKNACFVRDVFISNGITDGFCAMGTPVSNGLSDCLSCSNSFSLQAGCPFDDGSVYNEDRLICMAGKVPELIPENGIFPCKHKGEKNID